MCPGFSKWENIHAIGKQIAGVIQALGGKAFSDPGHGREEHFGSNMFAARLVRTSGRIVRRNDDRGEATEEELWKQEKTCTYAQQLCTKTCTYALKTCTYAQQHA